MPTYEYHCMSCQKNCEILQKITEEPLKTCPHCQENQLRRGPGGGIGLSFSGSGFYITDYGKKSGDAPKTSPCCPCGKNQSCD